MPVCLVVHDAPAARQPALAETALRDAVWELAPSHWQLGDGTLLLETGLSPDYVRVHLTRAMQRAGTAAPLLVLQVGADASWGGLTEDGEAWLRSALG